MTTNSQVKGSSMKAKKLSAFSLLAVSALILSGCSSSDSAGVKIEVPDIPMHESMGDFEGEINIVNWAGFVDPKWTDKFEADTGCMVKSRTAGTSDEMVTYARGRFLISLVGLDLLC